MAGFSFRKLFKRMTFFYFRKASKFEPLFLRDLEIVRKVAQGTYLVKNNSTNRFSKINVRDIKLDLSHPTLIDTNHEPVNDEPNADDTNNQEVANDTENEHNGPIDSNDFPNEENQSDKEILSQPQTSRFGRPLKPTKRLDL